MNNDKPASESSHSPTEQPGVSSFSEEDKERIFDAAGRNNDVPWHTEHIFAMGAEYDTKYERAKQAQWLEKDEDYQQLKKENQAYAIAQEGNLAKLDELNAKQAELIAEYEGFKNNYRVALKEIDDNHAELDKLRTENEKLEKADKTKNYAVKQMADGLRLANNILDCKTRETAAFRQIDFANRLAIWLLNDCKGEMPKWIP